MTTPLAEAKMLPAWCRSVRAHHLVYAACAGLFCLVLAVTPVAIAEDEDGATPASGADSSASTAADSTTDATDADDSDATDGAASASPSSDSAGDADGDSGGFIPSDPFADTADSASDDGASDDLEPGSTDAETADSDSDSDAETAASDSDSDSDAQTADSDADADDADPDAAVASQASREFERQKALDLIDDLRQWPTPVKREVEERTGVDIDELSTLDDDEIDYPRLRQIYRNWRTAAELATATLRTSTKSEGGEFDQNCPLNRFCQPRLDCLAEGLDPKICRALKRKRRRGAVRDSSDTSVVVISRNNRPGTERFYGGRVQEWRTTEEDFVYRAADAEAVEDLARRREEKSKEKVQLSGYIEDIIVNPEKMTVELDVLKSIETFWRTVEDRDEASVELRVYQPDQLLNLRQTNQFGTMADVAWLAGTELSKVLRTHTKLNSELVSVRVVVPERSDDEYEDDEEGVEGDANVEGDAGLGTEGGAGGDEAGDGESPDSVQLSGDLINAVQVRIEVLFFYSRLKKGAKDTKGANNAAADGEAGSEADADANGEAAAESDADDDANADAESDTDDDANADAESGADGDTNADAESDADGDANSEADADANTNADGESDADEDANAVADV
ncbi:MAG: MSCRAMM family adhesin SdrC, partial [Proteobacteria bacterium]|nr:MSCRAMM family adhesin SdrC [Pseudomonadota bacterium]